MKISPNSRTIKDILAIGFYRIPRFQRPYSWDKVNIEDFWRDIAEREGSLFIGSMVAFRESQGSDVFMVVDGQQRLTTITILLAVIRNALLSLDEELGGAIQSFIERNNTEGKRAFILTSETTHPYFQAFIQEQTKPHLPEKPLSEEEKALKSAFQQFTANVEAKLKGASDPGPAKTKVNIETLRKLRDRILSLQVIFIELDEEDDAYVIFETLNTRGKDLEVSDLVKNYVFNLIRSTNKSLDQPKLLWDEIRKTFGTSREDVNINTYLHHYWLSKYDYTTEKELFRRLKSEIRTKAEALDLLKKLSKESILYRAIYEPEFKTWRKEEREIARSLRALMIFRVRQQMPMVMAILRQLEAGYLTLKVARDVLRSIEAFHFHFTAITSQRSSGGISFMYASSAKAISSAKESNKCARAARDLIKKLRDKLPSFEEFLIGFAELKFSNSMTARKPLVQYILEELHRSESSGTDVDYSGMSIEHLSSQNPGDGSGKLNEDLVGSMGNLLLVPTKLNTDKLKNLTFAKKKTILINKQCQLDEQIRKASKWGEKEINTRMQKLAKAAYEDVWKI